MGHVLFFNYRFFSRWISSVFFFLLTCNAHFSFVDFCPASLLGCFNFFCPACPLSRCPVLEVFFVFGFIYHAVLQRIRLYEILTKTIRISFSCSRGQLLLLLSMFSGSTAITAASVVTTVLFGRLRKSARCLSVLQTIHDSVTFTMKSRLRICV